jgi:hypothetical protein
MPKKLTQEELAKRKEARALYLQTQGGSFASYFGMIGDTFSKRVNQLAQLIQHDPSLGTYKERLLLRTVSDFLPKRYAAGTGFVVFPKKRAFGAQVELHTDLYNNIAHDASSQLDIVVYDQAEYPPLFIDGDFVVLRPESVRAVIEMKGSLKKQEMDSAIDLFADYAAKWQATKSFYEELGVARLIKPVFLFMAWGYYIFPNGLPDCTPGDLRVQIVEKYKAHGAVEDIASGPILNAACVHNDCIVSSTLYSGEDTSFGYTTRRGWFVLYDDAGQASQGGDATVSHLLAAVHSSLETPFNQYFEYVDQAVVEETMPHPQAGYEPWVKGDDVSLFLEPNEENDE